MAKPDSEDSRAPVVWLLTDNKPGHRSQLKGIGNRLRVLAGANLYWIDAVAVTVPLWRTLLAAPPPLSLEQNLPHPDLVIAAGSGTHRLLLALRKRRGTKSLVIMKPDFPLALISGALIPAHDGASASSRVFVSNGVINPITPMAKITDQRQGLILVGGPSPHFNWEDEVIFGQVSHLISHYPQWRWTISSSRRTPEALGKRLDQLAGLKVQVVHPRQTHASWLSHQLAASRAVWVTPDSMSMVCEAVTSGVPTGLFELPARRSSRVAEGIDRLVQDGYLARWRAHASVMAGKTDQDKVLWEADRAGRWIIERGFLPLKHGARS